MLQNNIMHSLIGEKTFEKAKKLETVKKKKIIKKIRQNSRKLNRA